MCSMRRGRFIGLQPLTDADTLTTALLPEWSVALKDVFGVKFWAWSFDLLAMESVQASFNVPACIPNFEALLSPRFIHHPIPYS